MRTLDLVLELPGSVFSTSSRFAVEADAIHLLARAVIELGEQGIHMLVTVGFGNLQNLIQDSTLGTDRYVRDVTAGLAAEINALLLYTELEKRQTKVKLLSSADMQVQDVSEVYSPGLAVRYLADGFRVLCNTPVDQGGLFDEDLCAAVRGVDVSAAALCKIVPTEALRNIRVGTGTGPLQVTSEDAILGTRNLPFSGSASSLCRDHHLPVIISHVASIDSLASLLATDAMRPDAITVLL